MSIRTWQKEYYPTSAQRNCETDLTAIQHSLKKYEGMKSANLKKHDVWLEEGSLCEPFQKTEMVQSFLVMGNDQCALCHKHYTLSSSEPCATCPLYISGNHCLHSRSPYRRARKLHQPGPLIKALTILKNQCNKKGKWIPPKAK